MESSCWAWGQVYCTGLRELGSRRLRHWAQLSGRKGLGDLRRSACFLSLNVLIDLLAGLGHTSFLPPLCTLWKGQISKIQVVARLTSGNVLLQQDPSLFQSLWILEAINIMWIFWNLFPSLGGGCLTSDFPNKSYLQSFHRIACDTKLLLPTTCLPPSLSLHPQMQVTLHMTLISGIII